MRAIVDKINFKEAFPGKFTYSITAQIYSELIMKISNIKATTKQIESERERERKYKS